MFVAVDDTDSMRGNCTTYLATEIIYELVENLGLDLIEYPKLVRLNPAVPWKTRGNGSLVMAFGRGKGNKTKIGEINGSSVFVFEDKEDWEPSSKEIKEHIIPLIEKFHDPVDSDPGLVISSERPSYSFYVNGVTRIVKRDTIIKEIQRLNAEKFELGCGRGLIGCVCGMAWIPEDYTFELLTYRPQKRWGTERIFEASSVKKADELITTSFNNIEDRSGKIAIFPGTPCPVLYGFRGNVPDDLIRGHEIIKTEEQSRWIIFQSNQGTDDHIITDFTESEFIPNSSYLIKGTVVKSERVKGGHTFLTINTKFGSLECAAYEPSGDFRYVIDWLSEGDVVEVMGELRDSPRTLNIEKIHVLETKDEFRKISNPKCPSCGRSMVSIGKNKGYRCKQCSTKAQDCIMKKNIRWIVPGWYEPPVSARRHLSKPLKRMNIVQPVEFVNCRN